MLQSGIVAVVLFCLYGSSDSYKMTMKMSQSNFKQSMMKKISGVACASVIFVSSISGMAMPAIAAVGEGDLPPGAMAFQKLLKYQVFRRRLYYSSVGYSASALTILLHYYCNCRLIAYL